jgi:acylglycerol lipase
MKKLMLVLSIAAILGTEAIGMVEPFSYKELQAIPAFPLKQQEFLSGTDKVQLAYYVFLPKQEPKTIVIMYHGGGAYINAPYQFIGKQLATDYSIGAYMLDIRGHGNSEGARGDAPSIDQVFSDITMTINFVHQCHPQAKIYLAGHSSGAGLILNYGAHTPLSQVAGYICLSPYLGPNSGTLKDHIDPKTSFVKSVRAWVYIIGGISGGWLCAHTPAVYFNHSSEILTANPLMVPYYTYTMSCATTPYNTKSIFEKLTKPATLYIGNQDEQFIPEKVVEYTKCNSKNLVTARIVSRAKHLSILLQAPALIAQAIQ